MSPVSKEVLLNNRAVKTEDLQALKYLKYPQFAEDEKQRYSDYTKYLVKQYYVSFEYLVALNNVYLLRKMRDVESSKL